MAKQLTFLASIESYSFSDVHLFKDVLLVPLLLGRYLHYHVTIVCHSLNAELLHTYFPDADFDYIPYDSYENHLLNYIHTHGKNIDLVFAFGPYPSYYSILSAYKSANPSGKVYMKLDVNRYWLQQLLGSSLTMPLFSMCDFISSESRYIASIVSATYNHPVYYLPNGYYSFFPSSPTPFSEKENVILTVGRLGDACKQTNLLIETFLKAHLQNYQLRLVGSIDPSLYPMLNIYRQVPYFNTHVTFTGSIFNKQMLELEYSKAKIFLLTSSVECCAHVFAEAAKYGCYIISTDVDGVYDITLNEKYGTIIRTHNINDLSQALIKTSQNPDLLKETCTHYQAYARSHFSWDTLISDFASELLKSL